MFDPASGWTRRFGSVIGASAGSFLLTGIVDESGNAVTVEYDERAVPVCWSHSGGFRVEVSSEEGRVVGLSLSRDGGRPMAVRSFGYDRQGRLSRVINASGEALRFGYDDLGRLLWWADRGGERYDYTYDETGACVAGAGCGGILTSRFVYDSLDRCTTAFDSLGEKWVYKYDEEFQITSVTDPTGASTSTVWDRAGRRSTVKDPSGQATSWTYDDDGNIASVQDPGGRVTAYEWLPGRSLPTSLTGPDGQSWGFEYDRAGRLIASVDPLGGRSVFSYDERGGLVSAVDASGVSTWAVCDAAGLPVEIVDGAGRATRVFYDVAGRPVRVIDAAGESSAAWNVDGLLTSRIDADGGRWGFVYDGEGNLVEEVDPNGRVTRHEYGVFDSRVSTTAPDGAVTRFRYDSERRLVGVVDALGREWVFERDSAGRVIAQTDVNGARTVFSYDLAGRLILRVNAAGQRVRYDYDQAGDLAQIVTDGAGMPPEGAGLSAGVTRLLRDSAGRVVRAASDQTDLVIDYDAAGRVVGESWDGAGVSQDLDSAGRLAGVSGSCGGPIRYEYDASGLLSTVVAGQAQIDLGYDASGREITRRFATAPDRGAALTGAEAQDSGSVDRFGRVNDPLESFASGLNMGTGSSTVSPASAMSRVSGGAEVTSVWTPGSLLISREAHGAAGQVGAWRKYQWDLAGQLTRIIDAVQGAIQFRLDSAGRVVELVTASNRGSSSEAYTYDLTGQVTDCVLPEDNSWFGQAGLDDGDGLRSVGDGHGSLEFAGSLVHRVGAWHYDYDVVGRVVCRRRRALSGHWLSWLFSWDGDDRLRQVTAPDGSWWVYYYDLAGRRIGKTHYTSEGAATSRTRYVWVGNELLSATTTEGGPHVSANDVLVEAMWWIHHPSTGEPLTQHDQETAQDWWPILTDPVGTPVSLVDRVSGRPVWSASTTLWGLVTSKCERNPSKARSGAGLVGLPECLLGSPGQIWDSETGWAYNRYRYYDPIIVSFTSPDPLAPSSTLIPMDIFPTRTLGSTPMG